MTHPLRIAALLFPVLVFGTAITPAAADPLLITAGSAYVTQGQEDAKGVLVLSGPSFSAWLGATYGNSHLGCLGCMAGDAISVETFLGGPDGTLDVGGVHYTLTQDLIHPTAAGELLFEGPSFRMPSTAGSTLTITQPFTFTGSIVIYPYSEHSVDVSLIGSGIATASYMAYHVPGYPTGYLFDSATFTFGRQPPSPTPEPSTVLLVGSAIGAVVVRRIRRQDQTRIQFR